MPTDKRTVTLGGRKTTVAIKELNDDLLTGTRRMFEVRDLDRDLRLEGPFESKSDARRALKRLAKPDADTDLSALDPGMGSFDFSGGDSIL